MTSGWQQSAYRVSGDTVEDLVSKPAICFGEKNIGGGGGLP